MMNQKEELKCDWLNEALQETVEAIESGCKPLKLKEDIKQDIREALGPDFEKMCAIPRDWTKDKRWVIPLGNLAGSYGAMATMASHAQELAENVPAEDYRHDPPNEVHREHVFAAITFIATIVCPPDLKTGGYCEQQGGGMGSVLSFLGIFKKLIPSVPQILIRLTPRWVWIGILGLLAAAALIVS